MNAFNRLIMLIIALLLIAGPVFLLLVGLGVIPVAEVNAYTGYQGLLDALGSLSVLGFGNNWVWRAVIGLGGALLALLALLLLLRELTFGRPVARKTLVEEAPGRETAVTAKAIKHLAEGAAQEAGAASPDCRLASSKERRYEVSCDIQAPVGPEEMQEEEDYAQLASRARGNIRRVLEEQGVPVKEVEVTVRGTASGE